MNKYLKCFIIIAVIAVAFTATSVYAQTGDNVFSTILERLLNTFKNVRNVIFVVGGFGLIGLGLSAIFGKVKWPWLAALAAGLAVIALAGALIDYVTKADAGSGDGSTYDATWDDTLTN